MGYKWSHKETQRYHTDREPKGGPWRLEGSTQGPRDAIESTQFFDKKSKGALREPQGSPKGAKNSLMGAQRKPKGA